MVTRIRWDEVKSVVRELIEASAAAGTPLGAPIVLLGGSALAAHGARDDSLDVDIYVPVYSPDVVHDLEATLRTRYGAQFRLDVTRTENIWGIILLRDIASSPLVGEIEVAGEQHALRALTLEDLYLLKLLADRQKDRADRALIARRIDADALIARFNQVLGWYGSPGGEMGFADAIVADLRDRFALVPEDVIARLDVPRYVRAELEATYGHRPEE